MNTLAFKPKNKHPQQDSKNTIVDLFQVYCINKFSSEKWEELMSIEIFYDMMTNYYPESGDAVFSTLADLLADLENIPIKDLLSDFAEFLRRYY